MDFEIEGNFRKVSKIVTMLSKIAKTLKVHENFVVKTEKLHATFFPKMRFEYPHVQTLNQWKVYSTSILNISRNEPKLGSICQKTCFFIFCLIVGCFQGHIDVNSSNLLLDTGISCF